jgi:hypothetical protein
VAVNQSRHSNNKANIPQCIEWKNKQTKKRLNQEQRMTDSELDRHPLFLADCLLFAKKVKSLHFPDKGCCVATTAAAGLP